ncbi:hypothetical protein CEXT_556131 [Caerostris extrusa]|uniref:Ycf15 n=1 Tax=Caerostris extrusa TaxID=172846 RepID=A0AAV4RKA4_CAEEX|nr:hypothetical protein CEXT_556131 [Caerostris extrusa]
MYIFERIAFIRSSGKIVSSILCADHHWAELQRHLIIETASQNGRYLPAHPSKGAVKQSKLPQGLIFL